MWHVTSEKRFCKIFILLYFSPADPGAYFVIVGSTKVITAPGIHRAVQRGPTECGVSECDQGTP